MNYQKNKMFYSDSNGVMSRFLQIILAIILLVACICIGNAAVWIWIILVCYIIIKSIVDAKAGRVKRVSVDEIKEAQNKLKIKSQKIAVKEFGIDKDESQLMKPLVIGYDYHRNIVDRRSIRKVGLNKIFSSNYKVIVIYFLENQILIYKRIESLIKKEEFEETESYNYSDIYRITTGKENIKISENNVIVGSVNLNLFKIELSKDNVLIYYDAEETEEEVKRILMPLRQIIKEKRNTNE